MDFPLARQRFYQEICQLDDQINLAKAALYLAQEEYAQLDPDEYLNALDVMAAEVIERLPQGRYPLRILQTINQYLYDDLGFKGNTERYYDPRNSFLNDVLERRTGIPITLSVVYMEIAKRIDFPMVGVGMPGHFLIRPVVDEMTVFVDPFNRGDVLFPEDCQARLEQVLGQPVEWRPEFLEAVSTRQILARMLTNLKIIYLQQNDRQRALSMVERILLLFPNTATELRDRGLLYYQAGRWSEAIPDLEAYLNAVPDARDGNVIQELLRRMAEG